MSFLSLLYVCVASDVDGDGVIVCIVGVCVCVVDIIVCVVRIIIADTNVVIINIVIVVNIIYISIIAAIVCVVIYFCIALNSFSFAMISSLSRLIMMSLTEYCLPSSTL